MPEVNKPHNMSMMVESPASGRALRHLSYIVNVAGLPSELWQSPLASVDNNEAINVHHDDVHPIYASQMVSGLESRLKYEDEA